MNTLARTVSGGLFVVVCVVLLTMLTVVKPKPLNAQQAAAEVQKTYVGTLKCAACHFPKYKAWKLDAHAKAFEILPAKYKKDAGCLKCHTTGYGEPTGYKDASTATLGGTTCEACHGPGSEHMKIAMGFLETDITPAAEKRLREAIVRIYPGNVCIKCHVSQAHKDPHPDYDKE